MKFKLLYLGGVEARVMEYVQYVDRSLAEVFNTPVVLGMYMLSGRAKHAVLIGWSVDVGIGICRYLLDKRKRKHRKKL